MISFKEYLMEKIENVEQLRQSLIEHYKNGYTSSEKKSIKAYTGEESINEYIHTVIHKDKPLIRMSSHLKLDTKKDEYDSHIKNLDSVLKKKKTPHTMHVYAATWFDPTTHPNNTYHSKGYMSTSISKKAAKSFARGRETGRKPTKHIIRIQIPKDSHGAYVESHAHPEYSYQKEFMLPRGTTMKYKKSIEDGEHIIHHMELHPLSESHDHSIEINNIEHRHMYDHSKLN